MKTAMLVVLATLVTPAVCYSAGCDDYPYSQGIVPEPVQSGLRLLSTASVSVSFDDIDAIKDARDEATLEAKGQISEFLSEGIKSELEINKVVNESKSMQGEDKANVRKETIDRLKRLAGSSSSLLRGVLPLGECYTKGKELRVTVGIKPETIKWAENLSGKMSNAPVAPGTNQDEEAQKAAPQSPRGGLTGVDSYSNTSGLNKF
jgi:hypothetical protein